MIEKDKIQSPSENGKKDVIQHLQSEWKIYLRSKLTGNDGNVML